MEEEFVEDSNAMSYSFVSENHSEPFVMPHFFQLPEDELDLIFKFDPPIVEQIAPIPEIVENPKTNSPVILVAEKGEEKMEKKELISVPEEEEKDLIVVPEAEEKPIKEQILIPNNDDIEEQDLIPVPETDDESLDEDELIMILENNFPLTITTSSNTIRSESRNSQAFSELSEPTEELNLKVELSGDFKKYGYNYEYSAPSASVDELRTVNTLAIGHFSQIIALRRISDDKRFALKAINREGIGAQEAQILSNLSHINIVQLEALLLYKKRYQLVMEQGICSHEKFRGTS